MSIKMNEAKTIITDHEIQADGLPRGATGVRWIDNGWTDCAGVLQNNYWDAIGTPGEILFDLPGRCDFCTEVLATDEADGLAMESECTMEPDTAQRTLRDIGHGSWTFG